MNKTTTRTHRDRELLATANQQGTAATLGAYFRLSGPGWLQSAITLGGGSLGGALYLGMLGGTSMLWLQMVAIIIGVIMLSAIAYVTLSTGQRPYNAINEYVNPVLGIGWITATILANMIWILPQFSLCYDALDKTLIPGGLGEDQNTKIVTSLIIACIALGIVIMSFRPGFMSRMFDWLLKIIVGIVVVCFVAVVYKLFAAGEINFGEILSGFIPDFTQWNRAAPEVEKLLAQMPDDTADFWRKQVVGKQQSSMIGVTATAVGLNMTFLLPYSMLARGWDKPFRGLARFDLITAMAIPYIIVTTCIVIASANAFHAKADKDLLSNDPVQLQQSVFFNDTMGVLEARYKHANGENSLDDLNAKIDRIENDMNAKAKSKNESKQQQVEFADLKEDLAFAKVAKKVAIAEFTAGLSESEKRLAPTLVKPNSKQLASTLAPLFGEGEQGAKTANFVFGLGALAMGFSTIIILMLINSYAFAEIMGRYESTLWRTIGAAAAAACGFCWFLVWVGGSKTWLIIVASTFGAILLPIAYISFFALMNSRKLLGADKPTGLRMGIWNLLMLIGVMGALLQAVAGTRLQMEKPGTGSFVIGGVATFLLLALIGFSAKLRPSENDDSETNY